MDIYIQAAEHISVQKPLSDGWLDAPIEYNSTYIRAIEPDYKSRLSPNIIRRTGNIIKRAIITSRAAVINSGIDKPDAIISGTGLGCIENTEYFLDAMVRKGEELLQPAYFMQSTHNSISSAVAIDLQCNGYNSTYSHKAISFESALEDACLQFDGRKIKSALVGGYDEMTPEYFLLLSRIGYWRVDSDDEPLKRGKEAFSGETSVSFMLSSEKNEKTICRTGGVHLLYKPSEESLQFAISDLLSKNGLCINDVDAIFTGISGNSNNDEIYYRFAPILFGEKPLAGYKHVFGESYTAAGLGMYAAATCIRKQRIPQHLLLNGGKEIRNPKTLLLHNHSDGKNHSLILLTI